MKFRKGDKVRIVRNVSGHKNDIGSTTMIVSVEYNSYELENGYWAIDGELDLADAKPNLPTLPYGCELICKEMEVSDYEDFKISSVGFVVFKANEEINAFHMIKNNGKGYFKCYARPIDHKKKATKAKIEKLEAEILELKKELNGISD